MKQARVADETVGIYFFSHDCRIHDNPLLRRAADEVDQLLCVFSYPKWWSQPNSYGLTSLGPHRAQFLQQTLEQLDQNLRALGQALIITDHAPIDFIESISTSLTITNVYHSNHVGVYENHQWRGLRKQLKSQRISVTSLSTHTLFNLHELPFDLHELPSSFTKFRKLVEKNSRPQPPTETLLTLPPTPLDSKKHQTWVSERLDRDPRAYKFHGGENAGLKHLRWYFSASLPAHYKDVRNEIHGWSHSTKFSPWLANGALSARTLYAHLTRYETEVTKNSSTYWIYFELLWREYFQWYAKKHQSKLFAYRGIQPNRNPLTSYYPERFRKWCVGNTPYPLVNACMRELTATGFLSNRGRQIVASCLVNELKLDWRYGAAYFEQQLIDYDVASNWGNWQYLAGVGADTRDNRHFNLQKQTEQFDALGEYRALWKANDATSPLDSVDAADWPIA